MLRLVTALSRCATRARVAQRKAHRRKGFNLLEAAIVLGVIGLVIGGIWVAASAVAFNYKVNRMDEGFGIIIQNLKNQTRDFGPSWVELINTSGTGPGINIDILPSDWKNGTTVNRSAPFGITRLTSNGDGSFYFQIVINEVQACRILLPRWVVRYNITGSASPSGSSYCPPTCRTLDQIRDVCGGANGTNLLMTIP